MQLHETLRACALDDLARLTSLLSRENDPKADREFCESLLRAPAHFKLTPLEHAAAHALSALAAYQMLTRSVLSEAFPAQDIGPLPAESNFTLDHERHIAGRWEVFRLSALSYARKINDPDLIEGFQPPTADAEHVTTVRQGQAAQELSTELQPQPLTTAAIADCFAGLRWETAEKWMKPLGDLPKWLVLCLVQQGQRGVSERLWNPVKIGAWLVHNGHGNPNNIRAKFQTMHLLEPWFDAWKTYEADYLDTR